METGPYFIKRNESSLINLKLLMVSIYLPIAKENTLNINGLQKSRSRGFKGKKAF